MTTNLELKNAKPKDKDYTINVGIGLSLLVKKTGSKLWRFRYSFAGKRCMISLGKYPQISMKEAKSKQRSCLELLDKGINPSTHKKVQKAKQATEKTFREVAKEWHERHYTNSPEKYKNLVWKRLEKHIFPKIGDLPIKTIEAPMLFNVIENIQVKGNIATGQTVNSYCSMTFRYGVAKGYCNRDLTQDYKGMLKTASKVHMPTLTDIDEIAEFLDDIYHYEGTIATQIALMLSAYVFLRPSELAQSEWSFIDWEKSQWTIPAELMKMNREHVIPFPKQVKELLLQLKPITGHQRFLFPARRKIDSPMNSETVNKAIRRIDNGKYVGRMVSHGFRGMASTILNENKFRYDVIERQLAHVERNQVRNAYNHADYLEERTEMLQWYADYLDELRMGYTATLCDK